MVSAMTVDLLLRVLGVVVTPIVTVLIFLSQDGRRRSRLAKQAKAAGEIRDLTPERSPLRSDLEAHFDEVARQYLRRDRLRRNRWELRNALATGTLTA